MKCKRKDVGQSFIEPRGVFDQSKLRKNLTKPEAFGTSCRVQSNILACSCFCPSEDRGRVVRMTSCVLTWAMAASILTFCIEAGTSGIYQKTCQHKVNDTCIGQRSRQLPRRRPHCVRPYWSPKLDPIMQALKSLYHHMQASIEGLRTILRQHESDIGELWFNRSPIKDIPNLDSIHQASIRSTHRGPVRHLFRAYLLVERMAHRLAVIVRGINASARVFCIAKGKYE